MEKMVAGILRRRRLLSFHLLQVVFAAAVSLAAMLFIATGTAGSPQQPQAGVMGGVIITKVVTFNPDEWALSAYNDHDGQNQPN